MFSFVWGIPSSVSGFTSTKPLSSSSSLLFSSDEDGSCLESEKEEEKKKRDRISHCILLSGIF